MRDERQVAHGHCDCNQMDEGKSHAVGIRMAIRIRFGGVAVGAEQVDDLVDAVSRGRGNRRAVFDLNEITRNEMPSITVAFFHR